MNRFAFRSWPIKLKFGVIPLVAASAFVISTLVTWVVADLNSRRLAQIEYSLVPAIEVANTNNVRLERVADTLESSVSIGDADLAGSTQTIWKSFMDDLAGLDSMEPRFQSQSEAIRNACMPWYELALPLSVNIIDNVALARDPKFMQSVSSDRHKMRALLQGCRQSVWEFRKNTHASLSQATNDAKHESSRAIVILLITGIAATFIVVMVGSFVVRAVLGALNEIDDSIKEMRLEDGLTGGLLRCTSDDEIGKLADNFNHFIESLRNLLKMTCSQKDEIQQKNREIEALNEELRIQATTDRLTNLKNFAYFQEELDKRLREYNRAICKHPISIIIIDIDHFKRFNDTYGHTAGNVALREVADRIARLARKMDSPCRYGGEEFVIILPNCDLAGASGLAERIRRAIEMEPIDIDAQMVSITGSMGVAQYVPEETMSCFIERADQSLYRAKEGGRNRVEVFSIEPTTSGLVGGSL